MSYSLKGKFTGEEGAREKGHWWRACATETHWHLTSQDTQDEQSVRPGDRLAGKACPAHCDPLSPTKFHNLNIAVSRGPSVHTLNRHRPMGTLWGN